MKKALIGYTGFVGSTLLKQTCFNSTFNSANINDIQKKKFSTVVCAGAPGQKWIANKNSQNDLNNINHLISNLRTIKCDSFILISTVDVFEVPIDINEHTKTNPVKISPYGLNRFHLEKFVESHFEKCLIVRLPGLVGPGLRKNIVFDFLHNNNIEKIDSRSSYQFYPIVNLWPDICTAQKAGINLVHLTAEPLTVAEIAKTGFGVNFKNELDDIPVKYDVQTIHSGIFGKTGKYQYSSQDSILAVRGYAQS